MNQATVPDSLSVLAHRAYGPLHSKALRSLAGQAFLGVSSRR